MAPNKHTSNATSPQNEKTDVSTEAQQEQKSTSRWTKLFNRNSENPVGEKNASNANSSDDEVAAPREKWALGILSDKETDEVPGSVLLMSKQHKRNEPLGLRHTPARHSASSLPSPFQTPTTEDAPRQSLQQSTALSAAPTSRPGLPRTTSNRAARPGMVRMFSGTSIKSALSHITEKKKTPDGKIILEPQPDDSLNDPLNWPAIRRDVALLSLGFYCMLGGGMTPVLAAGFNDVSKTYGVPVPTVALSTGFYMAGMGIGSVVASPTAILFGKRPVYLVGATLLIVSSCWCAASPNYASLVVARVIQGVAISPVECLPSATIAEIFFLHERAYRLGIYTLLLLGGKNLIPLVSAAIIQSLGWRWVFWIVAMIAGFCFVILFLFVPETFWDRTPRAKVHHHHLKHQLESLGHILSPGHGKKSNIDGINPVQEAEVGTIIQRRQKPHLHVGFAEDSSKPSSDAAELEKASHHDFVPSSQEQSQTSSHLHSNPGSQTPTFPSGHSTPLSNIHPLTPTYTSELQTAPPKSYLETLRPWNGRLRKDSWFKSAARPFILFAYPAILWSTLVYSLSVGWLIVLSESVSHIYREPDTYNFSALQTGLVYLSPFIGGVLGTAVAGRVSDLIVRFMSRRNGGVYEPEFRLVMGIPVLLATAIGLMGFGWSAEERDSFWVPTIFFGVISFGCTLGSTTAITFAVDSYRAYAGEALVTLNFSKNVFHGLVFSLFFPDWLESDGAKNVFVAIGGIQVACLLTTIPMYIYGKRARMWTVRKNMMERF